MSTESLLVGKEVTTDEVKHNQLYHLVTERGKYGLCKADVVEEWTEVHPRIVYFVAETEKDGMLPGDRVTKIFEALKYG